MRISRLLAALVVLGLAGCSYQPPNPATGQVYSVSDEQKAAERQLAATQASRWDAATADVKGPLYLPMLDGAQGSTAWEASLVPPELQTKVVIRGAAGLPGVPHPTATVSWGDRVEITLPMISPGDALARAYPSSRC